ncbi:bifunctional apoptosis regulator-like [Saccostrea echinata]|uniref:bifunctional apoptosis regulator-like n=1 Tax=Saccostrea echinata TaxID=191078 RepID=UPI002A80ED3D|nr:bifunctional apoptosis regulator-like [Saccostrea echinata]
MADDDSDEYHSDDADRSNNYFHRQGSLESEFICGCCSDLLVQPTTLTCGHSFCRLCLAQWFTQSRKRTCPLCQQPYVGSPSVNITIKNLIEKSYSHKLREREVEVYTLDNENLIKSFEENRQAAPRRIVQGNNNVQIRDFCSGILVMGGVILLVYLVMYWKSVGSDLLIHKPPARWGTEDVVQWLSDLGSWTEGYRETARLNGIDGRLLLAVDHASLQSSLNVTNDLHIKAISTAIQQLKDFNMKLPASLWEYKALNPGRSLFLVYGIKDFPRTTMLYIYLFEYDEIFLPFLHSTFPENTDIPIIHMFDDPSRRQEIEFWSTFAVLPYWVITKFCWSWFDVHFWISMLMFFNCATLTFIEAITFKKSFPIRKQNCLASLKSYGKGLLSMVFFVVIWPVVPSLVCDFLFYSVLFFTPYHNVDKIRKELR